MSDRTEGGDGWHSDVEWSVAMNEQTVEKKEHPEAHEMGSPGGNNCQPLDPAALTCQSHTPAR